MNLLEKYLGESRDVRGVVKLGKVSLDTANDFQRQILNQSYYEEKSFQLGMKVSKAMGAKKDVMTLSQEEIDKIYKESSKYWKDGGKYVKVEGKQVKLDLNYDARSRKYYAAYSWGGWVGSTDLYKNPDQAIKEVEKLLMKTVGEEGKHWSER